MDASPQTMWAVRTEGGDAQLGLAPATGAIEDGPSQAHKDAFQKVKADLKQIVLELENELSLKFQIEAALHHEREQVFSSKHVKVMELRDTEVRELSEQRDTISSWLRRCVAEAERAAKELSTLKAEAEVTKEKESGLTVALGDLGIAEKVLKDELEAISARVDLLIREQQEIRDALKSQDSLLLDYHSEIEKSSRVASNHSADRVSLKSNARRIEVIEGAVSCIAASVRRADHVLGKVRDAVYHGKAELIDPTEDDGFDSEAEATSFTFPPKVATEVLPLIRGLLTSAEEIEARIKTFTANQSRWETERMEEHVRHLAAIRASNAKALDTCEDTLMADRKIICEMEAEREQLLHFLRAQQEDTVNALESGGPRGKRHAKRADSRISPQSGFLFREPNDSFGEYELDLKLTIGNDREQSDNAGAPAAPHVPVVRKLKTLDQIYDLCRAAYDEAEALRKNNAKWRDKLHSQEEDYASVQKLRHSYRDLESTKTMLSIDIREAEQRNKELKMSIMDYSDLVM